MKQRRWPWVLAVITYLLALAIFIREALEGH